MERSGAKSRVSVGLFAGLALLVCHQLVGCGESSSETPAPDTANGTMGGQNNGSTPSNSTGGSNATSGTPNREGSPNNIQLDPNRDQTVPINLVASGAVQCGGGGNYCVEPNLTCCTTDGMMGADDSNSCAPNAAACPAGTTSSASCSSVASCAAAQVCCRTAGGGNGPTTTSCETSCAMGSVQVCIDDEECGTGNQCNNNNTCGPIACTATSCGGGQLCCRNPGGNNNNNNVAACVAPGADSQCPNNQRQVCTTDVDCPATFICTGQGNNGGGVRLCIPPPCTTTSCAGGQICCVGGQVGGNATCSTANAGACPGNSRLLCLVDADCATAAGTLCLTAPNGGGNGQLSCRVPPPPITDAGAGDAG